MSATAVERKSKLVWINDSGKVKCEKGWECPPNDGVLWFPTLGYSTSGYRENREDAKRDAVRECQDEIRIWTKKLKGLNP